MDAAGMVTFLRTYSAKGQETWFDVCKRVVEGAWTIAERRGVRGLDAEYVNKWAEMMFDHMFNMRWLPAGRGLQHMGHDRMWVKGSGVLQNCAFVESADDGWVEFLANMSMLGVGVGFDMSGAGKHTLQAPALVAGRVFTVADTREGWVDVFRTLYKAVTTTGASLPEVFSLADLRKKGAPLATMGGVSSGPDPLGEAIVKFCKAVGVLAGNYDPVTCLVQLTPGRLQHTPLTSETILDIGNIVGVCVVSGGIRRSAEIAIFEPGDETVFDAKRDTDKLYAWRWASNNTIRYTKPPTRDEIRKVVQNCHDYGDPGMLFLYNVLGKGRTGDVNARERGHGCNPCGEQPLESRELCNLVEICLPRCPDYATFEQVACCALYYGKLVTMLPTGDAVSDEIMRRNRRIGVSVTGFVECADTATPWFNDVYSTMRKFDQRISRRHDVPSSVKITSVKPSGTVSLVLGCSPGMNPHFAPYYIRRINIEETSPLCAVLDAAGYPKQRNVYSKTSFVYEFPMRATGPTSLNAVQQLQNVLTLQANWSDNMVSNTIVFDEHEIGDIADFVHAHSDKFKSLAFLKREHGFEQAPLEEITEAEYNARAAAVRDLDLGILHGANTHDTEEAGCESGKCALPFLAGDGSDGPAL